MHVGSEVLRDHLLLDALGRAWADANWRYFRRVMVAPTFGLTDAGSVLGTWSSPDRTLSISRAFARTAPWPKIVEVLHHEMAHQYVAEVLRVTDETAHGPAFRRVLEAIGADVATEPTPESPILAKVRKLLALAGSSNRHEAEAAMKAAHRLMLTHNVDLAAARAAAGYSVRTIGPARVRRDPWEKLLVGLLASHFFVRVVWTTDLDTHELVSDPRGGVRFRTRTVAECTGTHANLEIAAWVYDFVVATGARMWADHKRQRGVTGDRERRKYLAGLVTGLRKRLDESAAQCAADGLVWVGDAGVDDLVGRRHPRLVRRGFRVAGGDAFRHGEQDGRSIVLHKPIRREGGGGGQLTG
jgi:hypothetical protein